MKNTFKHGHDFEFKIVNANIQPNTFDCGVYTIHYCIEFLEFSKDRQFKDVFQFLNDRVITDNDLNIPIIFECNQSEINKLRARILNLSLDSPKAIELRNLRLEVRNYESKVRFNISYMYQKISETIGDVNQVKAVDVVTQKPTIFEWESLSELSSVDENFNESGDEYVPKLLLHVDTKEPAPVKGMNING